MTSLGPFQNTGHLKDLPKPSVVPKLIGKSPSQSEKEDLVAQIHQSASIQSERIQAIVDGAILAVEQVQDKRIDLLEQGPEVTISDVIFDVFLSVCLIGVGKALVPITESIARELAQTASYYGQIQASGKVTGLAKALRYAAIAVTADFKEEYQVGTITPEEVQKYNRYVREILTLAAEEKAEKAVKMGIEKVKEHKSLTHAVDLEPTDTPGVAILNAAQSYASNQRAAITVHHAGFEAAVRSDANSETLELIRKAVTWPALNEEIIVIRDKHKMLFEAVIWAQLFGLDKNPNIKRTSFQAHLDLPGVTQSMFRYWRRRFARTIEKWLSSLPDKYPTGEYAVRQNEGVDLKKFGSWEDGKFKMNSGAFEAVKPETQEDMVIRFFAAVSGDLKKLEKIGEGAVQITTELIAKD